MALFLKNHSTTKSMILARQVVIRRIPSLHSTTTSPLEWTNNMSKDNMISFNDFLDIGFYDKASPSEPPSPTKTSTPKWQFF